MALPSADEMKARMSDSHWVDKMLNDVRLELLQADPMVGYIVLSLGSVPNSKRDVVKEVLSKELTELGYVVREVASSHNFMQTLHVSWGV